MLKSHEFLNLYLNISLGFAKINIDIYHILTWQYKSNKFVWHTCKTSSFFIFKHSFFFNDNRMKRLSINWGLHWYDGFFPARSLLNYNVQSFNIIIKWYPHRSYMNYYVVECISSTVLQLRRDTHRLWVNSIYLGALANSPTWTKARTISILFSKCTLCKRLWFALASYV